MALLRLEEGGRVEMIVLRQAAEGGDVHFVFSGLPFGIGAVGDSQGLGDLLLGISTGLALLNQALYESILFHQTLLLFSH